MSISSDVSKQAFSQLQASQEAQATTARDFKEAYKRDSQVVQKTADTDHTASDNKESGENHTGDESSNISSQLEDLKAEEVNQKMRQLNVSISFETSEDGESNIVKVLDRETGETVRQIPTEEFLKISKRIDEIFDEVSDLKGSLVNSEV
ncbi:flagellar protein FlaG [Marinomonas balearica]|uniref:Flagellar protein FlaG n=1 Tax=Marinomonas balearica TaxID=491947 RepID=A0A4R6M4J6_9GAMM|nr:flagellar protein FlaG [Marinomonas balearica]TDO96223.1 flagellar protein FlaG [Marinomonas balearica]